MTNPQHENRHYDFSEIQIGTDRQYANVCEVLDQCLGGETVVKLAILKISGKDLAAREYHVPADKIKEIITVTDARAFGRGIRIELETGSVALTVSDSGFLQSALIAVGPLTTKLDFDDLGKVVRSEAWFQATSVPSLKVAEWARTIIAKAMFGELKKDLFKGKYCRMITIPPPDESEVPAN